MVLPVVGCSVSPKGSRGEITHMASSKVSTGPGNTQTISEKLNQSAYSYYSSATVVPSGDRSTATGLKRFAAAALLSSSSIMVLSSPAAAMSVCSPIMPANGTTATCTGATTARKPFTGTDVTVVADENFNQDTSGTAASNRGSNTGISLVGNGGAIRNSGTIRTGSTNATIGHHGIYGFDFGGGMSGMSVENLTTGSITTSSSDSHGIRMDALVGASTATNRGAVTTQNIRSHGIYSRAASATGAVTSTNASGATITIGGNNSGGSVAVATTGSGTASASNAGTINVTGDDATVGVAALGVGGVASATNTGRINLQSTKVDMGLSTTTMDVGVIATSSGARAVNAAGGSIVDTGAGTSVGVYAESNTINLFAGTRTYGSAGAASATNDGSIALTGDWGNGIRVRTVTGVSTATNNGDLSITGANARGIDANGATVNVVNTGSVTATGTGAYGIVASTNSSPVAVNITNSGTVTQTTTNAMSLYGDAAIFAAGSTVNITNTATGTITGTNRAISVGNVSTSVTVINDGTMNGDVTFGGRRLKMMTVPTFAVTNSGTINGQVTPGSSFSANITNSGGTIGDGTYAAHTGTQDDVVTITGSGNVINGAFRDDGGTGAGNNVINFNQSDTLTLNGASRGYAFFGFETANFNSGTTVIAQERGIGTSRYMGTSQVNVNAGATLGTTSRVLGINTNQLTISGRGTTRGTLHAPAGSRIEVTNGNTTFNAGGRFRVGVASDTNAGYLNGGSGTVTFNAGSEIYADVTRGIELTEGGAGIKVVGVNAGEGGRIVDNNPGGVKVFDNTVLFSFTSEVRANSELYIIAKRELRARTATTNKGGRTNAENIASALDEFIDNAPTDNVIVRYLAQFPVDQQEQKLFELVQDSLPSESGATGSSTVVSTDMVLDLIMDRLSGGGFTVVDSGERQTGVAAGEQFLGGPGNWALWGRAGASFAEYEPSGVNGFDSDTYAMSLGLDGDIAEHLRMGLALFYSDTKVDENGLNPNSNQDIEGYGVLLYGTYRPEDFYVNATVGFGVNEYESQRLAAGGVNSANYDGNQFMSRVEVGKVFTDGAWDLSPHVGLRYNRVSIDGYTETGVLPTSIGSQSLTSLRGVLGLSGRYTHVLENGAKLIPEAYVRGLQELAGPNEAITGSIVGGGTFVSQSTERDKFSYATGVGLTYEMDDQFSVRFLYDGEFQTDYQEHSLTAAIRYQF